MQKYDVIEHVNFMLILLLQFSFLFLFVLHFAFKIFAGCIVIVDFNGIFIDDDGI